MGFKENVRYYIRRFLMAKNMGFWNVARNAARNRDRFANFYTHLKPGDKAPEFILRDLDGAEISLRSLLQEKTVALEFGAYT